MCGNEIEALRMICVLGYGASGNTRAATVMFGLVVPFLRGAAAFLLQRGECRLVTPTQETRTWWTRRKL